LNRLGPFTLAVLLCASCSSGSASSVQSRPSRSLQGRARPVGPPLRTVQVSYVGHVKGGIGSYAAQTALIDSQRSLTSRQSGGLLAIRGIGSVSVTCSPQPVAAFNLTPWAHGEGPPTVTRTVAKTHGLTSLAGLAGYFSLPRRETTRQVAYQWQISDGGGEAFQFSATVTGLLTPTTKRCDLLGEAAVVTTGAFYRYAH
jgi:hypothetical protein